MSVSNQTLFSNREQFVTPGPIGRSARFALGALSLSFGAGVIPFFSYYVSTELPSGVYTVYTFFYLIGALVAFALLNLVVKILAQ